MLLKQVSDKGATIAWSPLRHLPHAFATGTKVGYMLAASQVLVVGGGCFHFTLVAFEILFIGRAFNTLFYRLRSLLFR